MYNYEYYYGKVDDEEFEKTDVEFRKKSNEIYEAMENLVDLENIARLNTGNMNNLDKIINPIKKQLHEYLFEYRRNYTRLMLCNKETPEESEKMAREFYGLEDNEDAIKYYKRLLHFEHSLEAVKYCDYLNNKTQG